MSEWVSEPFPLAILHSLCRCCLENIIWCRGSDVFLICISSSSLSWINRKNTTVKFAWAICMSMSDVRHFLIRKSVRNATCMLLLIIQRSGLIIFMFVFFKKQLIDGNEWVLILDVQKGVKIRRLKLKFKVKLFFGNTNICGTKRFGLFKISFFFF